MVQATPLRPAAEKIISRDYLLLWFGLLFFMLNMSTFNLLPYYLELRGASPDVYGSVAGSMAISNVLCLLLLGRWADRWSRKATVSLYFLSSLAGNLVALWAMSQPSLNWYYLCRLLQGVFMGLGFPIVFSWAMELSPPRRKHVVLAWLGIGGILANSLGPSLGELVLSLQPERNDPRAYGPVFLLSTAFQLTSLGFFLAARNSRATPAEEGEGSKGLAPLLKRKESVLVLIVTCSFGGMFGVLMSFGKNYTASLELTYVSVLLWAYSSGAIFSRIFIQQITRYLTERHLVPLGLLGLGLTFLLLGLSRGYGLLGATGFLYGLSHGILYPTLFVRFLDFQRASEIGRGATLFQGSFSIGWGLFPLLGGTFVRLTNFPTLFSLLSALAGIGILLHLAAERLARQRSGTPAG